MKNIKIGSAVPQFLKGKCLQKTFILIIFTFSSFLLHAQSIPKAVRDDNQVIKNLTKRTDKSGWLYYKNGLKLTHNSLMNDSKAAFGLTSNDLMKLDKEQADELGGKLLRLKQYYKSVKVENADYVLRYDKKGFLTHSYGDLGEEIDNNTNTLPSINESQALNLAVNNLDGLAAWLDPVWEQRIRISKEDSSATYKPKGELVLISTDNGNSGKYNLAYAFDIVTINPMGDWKVYIDAKNRQLLKKISNVRGCNPVTINFTSLYNGSQSTSGRRAGLWSNWDGLWTCNTDANIETFDKNSRWNGTIVNNHGLSTWGTDKQQYTSAHWAVEKSWMYFKNQFNRNGWNNNRQKVEVIVDQSGTYQDFVSYYPNTNVIVAEKNLMSLDLVGHEFTHGNITCTSNLNGTGEAGALGESFSDIFGLLIKRSVTGNIDWMFGLDIPWNTGDLAGMTGIRNFQNPSASCCSPLAPSAPSIYGNTDPNWAPIYVYGDNGGIHTNCGVQNRWFYLLSQGGFQNGVNVQGIGIDKAAHITYNNMVSLTANATYQSAANGAVSWAESMYGCSSFELEQTRLAWQAVGINTPQPQLILNADT